MTPQEAFTTRLRRYRERNKISLDEIASPARIKRELLEAFERNDLSQWPRGVYARSWVRAYATAVGLDPVDTVNDFCRLFPQGDRRVARTIQDMAAIVAHPTEYRDEIGKALDRRRRADDPRPAPPWHAHITRPAVAMWLRFISLRPAPAPRFKGTAELQ